MDASQPSSSGLPEHVMQQLHQASQQVSQSAQAPHQAASRGRVGQRGNSHRAMSRGQPNSHNNSHGLHQPSQNPQFFQPAQQSGYPSRSVPHQSRPFHQPRMDQGNLQQNMIIPQAGDEEDFPALGSSRESKSSRTFPRAPSQPPGLPDTSRERAQEFFQRTRGGVYQGTHGYSHQSLHQGRSQQQGYDLQPQYSVQQYQGDDFRRPPPQHQAVYNPMAATVANQRHALRKRLALQCEYLETVAEVALQNQMSVEELQEKEAMRQRLESIMHDVIREYGRTRSTIDPVKVKLKCYGSLASGFAVAGSDMDLLVTFPRNGEPIGDIEEDIKRLFEKALLEAGYGARLLTQTRVPIMRVCETPTPDILDGLRRYRAKWEQDEQDNADVSSGDVDPNRLPVVTHEHIEAMSDIFAELGDEPGETPLPPSPGRDLPHLEYTKDCGAQCDINFSNYVALHNTRLLRTYCQHDERVRWMGVIVKTWTKSRKINTPYHGTLSSYGYILMLLHYLMNVVSPPVIPNVQLMAKDRDAWANKTDFETVDGFDVRFFSDPEVIAAAVEGRPRNQETLGALLRGFFWYYSDHQGFHWTNHIISIRTAGGVLTKSSKGWTEAKWTGAKNTIRNRYLLCIEDPFETEHNIARTVCHSGIVAIRDEFRRARKIIERVEKGRGVGWQWFEDNQELGQDFMAVAEDRGDLLRKDQDFHKLKRLKAEAEATEKALKEANTLVDLQSTSAYGGSKEDGTSTQHDSEYIDGPYLLEHEQPSRKLTCVGQQQEKHSPRSGRLRQVKYDSDDEEGDDGDAKSCENTEALDSKKDMSDNMGSSTSVRTKSSASEEQAESEPYCVYGADYVPRAVDSFGKLLPWDLNTQEGRWLQWRDGKVRDGTFTRISSPGLKALHDQCPFDPMRPRPITRSYRLNYALIKPPFPMCKPIENEATSHEDPAIIEDPVDDVPHSHDEPVGWDLSVSACRWLNERDEQIRAGTFNLPSQPNLRDLNDAFPFLDETPREEQLRRNEILSQRNTQWLKGEISQHVLDNFSAYVQYLEQEHLPNPQDENLDWDMSLSDGRWLKKRDGLVRDGLFLRLHYPSHTLQLHDDFPYIQNTPNSVQKQRNLKLKLRCLRRLIAEIPESVREKSEAHLMAEADAMRTDLAESCQSDLLPSLPLGSSATDEESQVMPPKSSEEQREDDESIGWVVFNRTGTWLNERDAAIRAGTWKHQRLFGWQQRTNKAFPFQPDTSREEQAERNEALSHWGSQGMPIRLVSTQAQSSTMPHEGSSEGIAIIEDDPKKRRSKNRTPVHDARGDLLPQIEWDRSLLLGTWFSWRDRKVRQCSWKPTADKLFFRWLDATLPYVACPTLEQQSERNELLQRITLKHPRLTEYNGLKGHQRPSAANMAEILSLTWDNELLHSTISQHDDPTILIDLEPIEEKPPHEDTDYLDFIRSQRLNYFASQSAAAADADASLENQKPASPQHGHASLAVGAAPSLMRSSSNDASSKLAPVPQAPTLHADASAAAAPTRLENAATIPVSGTRTFDERQLRDLHIIAQGGNGCARLEGEWDVEVDGEWGGGGWMGERGSGGEMGRSGATWESEKGQAKEWQGRGDEEGLLAELPRL